MGTLPSPSMDPFPRQFGLVIAYLLPGFVALAGLTPLIPTVGDWLHGVYLGEAGVGPPVYALIAATTLGMIVSCFRWLMVDHLLAALGVTAPVWDFSRIQNQLAALDYLNEGHYRYYQFYANVLVALVWAYPIHRLFKTSPLLGIGTDLGVVLVCAVLLAGARDALTKYYQRAGQLMGSLAEQESKEDVMTNGIGHHETKTISTEKRPKAQIKTEPAKKAEREKNLPSAGGK